MSEKNPYETIIHESLERPRVELKTQNKEIIHIAYPQICNPKPFPVVLGIDILNSK